jgi:Family of unknown function (DUF7009)
MSVILAAGNEGAASVKLRIKGDSLRLRLVQGEMRTLAERGQVEDRISFPGGAALRYRLRVDEKSEYISVSYTSNLIDILVPRPLAEQWWGTDLVTLSASQSTAAGELRLVLEKDWACLAPREGEDESDSFPHPEAERGAKTC